MNTLRWHSVSIFGNGVVLRPMTEDDWTLLAAWNSDPEVLWFSEGDDVESYSLEDVQDIYRTTSKTAHCFIIEVDEEPIGECWLQNMNLPRYVGKFPGKDCRRIDLMIGEKSYWGRGYGTEAIACLTAFGFDREQADLIFGCGIAEYNPRSLRAFQRNGYRIHAKTARPAGSKAQFEIDVVLTKNEYVEAG
jgi:RimJ/RimL family protein N-acetyltransferase